VQRGELRGRAREVALLVISKPQIETQGGIAWGLSERNVIMRYRLVVSSERNEDYPEVGVRRHDIRMKFDQLLILVHGQRRIPPLLGLVILPEELLWVGRLRGRDRGDAQSAERPQKSDSGEATAPWGKECGRFVPGNPVPGDPRRASGCLRRRNITAANLTPKPAAQSFQISGGNLPTELNQYPVT
jgi:hypothetical protein